MVLLMLGVTGFYFFSLIHHSLLVLCWPFPPSLALFLFFQTFEEEIMFIFNFGWVTGKFICC